MHHLQVVVGFRFFFFTYKLGNVCLLKSMCVVVINIVLTMYLIPQAFFAC